MNCFNCGNVCDEDDLCHGCGSYVCQGCDLGAMGGDHSRAEHLNDDYDAGDE